MISKQVSVKKIIGSEKRSNVLNKLGLSEHKYPKMGYQIIEGVPCKFVDGEWVKLKKVNK